MQCCIQPLPDVLVPYPNYNHLKLALRCTCHLLPITSTDDTFFYPVALFPVINSASSFGIYSPESWMDGFFSAQAPKLHLLVSLPLLFLSTIGIGLNSPSGERQSIQCANWTMSSAVEAVLVSLNRAYSEMLC